MSSDHVEVPQAVGGEAGYRIPKRPELFPAIAPVIRVSEGCLQFGEVDHREVVRGCLHIRRVNDAIKRLPRKAIGFEENATLEDESAGPGQDHDLAVVDALASSHEVGKISVA